MGVSEIRLVGAPGEARDIVSAWRRNLDGEGGPMRLSRLALHAQGLAQAVVAWSETRSEALGEKISCRKGCGACCRQVVPVSPPEAFLLAEILAELPGPEKAAALDRFARIGLSLEREGMLDLPLFHHAGAYFRLDLPCPFLIEEACSIHASRPLACREYLALSPAAHCSAFPDPFIRVMPLALSVGEALAGVAGEAAGIGPVMIPLARVLEWTAGNRELQGLAWEADFLLDRLASRCLEKLGGPVPARETALPT